MDLANFTIRHDPETCPTCAAIRDAQERAAIERGERCYWGVSGCTCWGDNAAELVASAPYTLADIGLTEDELDSILGAGESLGDEAESELARVIGEVRVGNYLTNDEGETLVQALVEEEQDHAETLADLGDAEDRIAGLEAELAVKDSLLDLASDSLEMAAEGIERAVYTEAALRSYIALLERRVAALSINPAPFVVISI